MTKTRSVRLDSEVVVELEHACRVLRVSKRRFLEDAIKTRVWQLAPNLSRSHDVLPRKTKPAKRTAEIEANEFSKGVGIGLRRAAETARNVARQYGTPIYIWRDGKVVAIKP